MKEGPNDIPAVMTAKAKAQVLLAEDDPGAARDIAASIEQAGHRLVAMASTGEEAIRLCESLHPDIVLMDVMLKGPVDGIAAGIQIQDTMGVAVIFLAAHHELPAAPEAVTQVPHGFLIKPFVERELSAAMAAALYRSRLERRMQEQRHWYEAILNCIGDGILATDVTGAIAFMNPAAERLTGWKRADAAGRPLAEVFRTVDEQHRQPVEPPEARALRDDTALVEESEDVLLVSADGTERPIVSTVSPINDTAGNLRGLVVAFRDTSSRRFMEQRSMNRQKMEALGKLSRNVAHDFGNIVGVIGGYAASMQEYLMPDSRAHEDVQHILAAVKHANSLTKRIFGVARASTPTPDLDIQPVRLGELVQSAASILGDAFSRRAIRVRIQKPEKMAMIAADSNHFIDLLIDLFLNAVDAMPQGGTLTIDTRRHRLFRADPRLNPKARPGRYVVLRIKDTGIGMSSRVLERIFEPFFTTKPKDTHAGLGLSIVNSAVQQYGGWVTVSSEQQKGSTVSLYLPESAPAAAARAVLPPAGATVLVADDNDADRAQIETLLRQAGYAVHAVAGGAQALDLHRQRQGGFDLAIVDLLMPECDGKTVVDEILKTEPAPAVIVVSGFSREYVRAQVASGSWRYLQKPYDPDLALATVRLILEQKTA